MGNISCEYECDGFLAHIGLAVMLVCKSYLVQFRELINAEKYGAKIT